MGTRASREMSLLSFLMGFLSGFPVLLVSLVSDGDPLATFACMAITLLVPAFILGEVAKRAMPPLELPLIDMSKLPSGKLMFDGVRSTIEHAYRHCADRCIEVSGIPVAKELSSKWFSRLKGVSHSAISKGPSGGRFGGKTVPSFLDINGVVLPFVRIFQVGEDFSMLNSNEVFLDGLVFAFPAENQD